MNINKTTDDHIDNSNRRRSTRIEATFCVKFNSLDSLSTAYTENISKGGIYIRTGDLLPLNSMVRIRMSMPMEGPEIECIGQVARVHKAKSKAGIPTGMAVVFRDMSDVHRAFIEDYISELSTQKDKGPSSIPPRKLTILVVDDDSTVRKKTSAVLKKHGHEVTTAEDGLKALAICLKEPPDLILSDVQMPKMDGWNFLKTIRARASLSSTLVIFQTSLTEEKDRLKGYQLGVDDYLSKPYSAKDLITSINKVVRRSQTNATQKGGAKALRGDLEQVSIPTVLSLLEMEKKTGILVVVGTQLCRLFVKQGRPMAVEIEGAKGIQSQMDLVGTLLEWKKGQFEFAPQDVPSVNKIKRTMQGMLLEAARLSDETGVVKLSSSQKNVKKPLKTSK